jgi:hypothetical protein
VGLAPSCSKDFPESTKVTFDSFLEKNAKRSAPFFEKRERQKTLVEPQNNVV